MLIAVVGAQAVFKPVPSPGAARVVTTLADSGAGSLRQALSDALPGDRITFSTNGTIRLTSGELSISNSVDIIGPGATNLAVSGNNASRVFNISAGATSSISGLTIRDGRTANGTPGSWLGTPGGNGGGLYSLGTVTLSNCSIIGNATGDGGPGADSVSYGGSGGAGGSGGSGGGVCNEGTLTLHNCTFTGNATGNGAYGGNGRMAGLPSSRGGDGGNGGSGGTGGGLYNTGSLKLDGCLISGNSTGNGGSGGSGGMGGFSYPGAPNPRGGDGGLGGWGGPGGYGAGLYSLGRVIMLNCVVTGNRTGNGAAGGAGGLWGLGVPQEYSGAPGYGGQGGSGGFGAGIWQETSTLTMSGSRLNGNTCGAGGRGGPCGSCNAMVQFLGRGGAGGGGGGVGNDGELDASVSEFSANAAGVGGIGSTNEFGSGSAGVPGGGGGILSQDVIHVRSCAFTGNSCYGQGGGLFNARTGSVSASTFIGNWAANGGGVYNGGRLTISNCTLSSNRCYGTGIGGGGIYTDGTFTIATIVSCTVVSNYGLYYGGGIYRGGSIGAACSVRNSLIAGNVASYMRDLFYVGSEGHNLVGSGGFTNTAVGDLIGVNPLLGPTADNGGPTLTHALLPGSPALDAGDDTLTGTDQRGRPRRAGAHVDIGAYEYGVASPQQITGLQRLTNGAFQFAFTNLTDVTFNVLATTNVALPVEQWLNLGPASRVADTLYQFTDPAATNTLRRFYQLRWP